ncbi:MAG TPA: hypothetical protein VMH28_23590 [Candidatus Acidoferrales bacterium]|nr:hypothetical protein [Candidatus Acidoferrales bacterium]
MRVCLFAIGAACFAQGPALKQVTWTGWFADEGCAGARLTAPVLTQTNPDCARKCLEKGAAPVFISEQARAIFKVQDYRSVADDLGYHLEVTATIDEGAKTISIESVKRISDYQGPSCARPKKK